MGKYDAYFDKVDLDRYQCRQCPAMLKNQRDGSTSHLRSHLRSRHGHIFQEIINEEENRKLQESFNIYSKKKALDDATINIDIHGNAPLDGSILFKHNGQVMPDYSTLANTVDNAITQLLCAEDLPFDLVEKEGFRNFMKKIGSNPFFVTEKKVILETCLPRVYEEYKKHIMWIIECVANVSLTVCHTNSEVQVYCNFIDESFNTKSVLLESTPLKDFDINKIMAEYGLGVNKVNAIASSHYLKEVNAKLQNVAKLYSSFSHLLDEVINTGIIALCTEERWNMIKAEYISTLIPDTSKTGTEWLAFYQRLASLHEQSSQNGNNARSHNFAENLDPTLSNIVSLLKPIYNAFSFISLEDFPLSAVIPTYRVLLRELTGASLPALTNARKKIVSIFSEQLNNILIDPKAIIATLLDVRFKDSFFELSQKDVLIAEVKKRILQTPIPQNAEEIIMQEVKEEYYKEAQDDPFSKFLEQESSAKRKAITLHEDNAYHQAHLEVIDYLGIPPNYRVNPLEYWKSTECRMRYPNLSQLAAEYLFIPAATTRRFSKGGRCAIDDENLKKISFLKYNIPILGFL